ncbi:hypothetical protein Q9R29_06445 [Rothia sp. ARF10]|nr:hypothetical protein [Rothia sp. ARF10]
MTHTQPPENAAAPSELLGPEILAPLLEDLLPSAARALVVGTTDDAALAVVARRFAEVTVVDPSGVDGRVGDRRDGDGRDGDRRDSDGRAGDGNRVTVAELPDPTDEGWDLVIAWDPDRDGAHGSPPSSTLLDRMAGLLAPGGTALVALRNPHPFADIVEGVPSEVTDVVVSEPLLARRLLDARRGPVTTYSLFGQQETTVVLRDDTAEQSGPGRWPTNAAGRAAGVGPDLTRRLAASGLTWTMARGWIGVIGGRAAPLYVAHPEQGWSRGVLTDDETEWSLEPMSGTADDVIRVGAGVTAEDALRRAMLDGDYQRFRALARTVGDLWRAASGDAEPDLRGLHVPASPGTPADRADDAHGAAAGGGVAGSSATGPAPAAVERAWRDFDDRAGSLRAPWDEALSASARLTQRLLLSGYSVEDRRARDVADPEPGLVDELRAALDRRETQLRHREEYIRGLRRQWTDAQLQLDESERELARLTSSPAYRRAQRAETLRSPRKVAQGLSSRGHRLLRRVGRIAGRG